MHLIRKFDFLKRFYLFIHERHTERGRDTGRGRSRLPVGSPMQDLIPGPWDHDLSQNQDLDTLFFFKFFFKFLFIYDSHREREREAET